MENAQLEPFVPGIGSAAAQEESATSEIQLSIVVPTFNESSNILRLFTAIDAALATVRWELIVVDDDSPDGTADIVRALARRDRRLRILHRVGRRGLSSACIEGMLSSHAPVVAVMDADMQHDEKLLPQMLKSILVDQFDVVVGSRYVDGGSVGEWDSDRARMSRIATSIGQAILSVKLKDPMSGFFMLRSDVFRAVVRNLSGQGFKILLDIIASAERPLSVKELPYEFRRRLAGESKLDHLVVLEYFTLILDKLVGRWVPVRFLLFSAVGALGVLIHLSVLGLALKMSISFAIAQVIATLVAMVTNYTLNNLFTYRDRRLHGVKFFLGLCSFILVCSLGVVANVGVASALFERDHGWWLAGIAGALVGSVWNYAVSSRVTWRLK